MNKQMRSDLDVSIKLGGKTRPIDLAKELAISLDPNDLNDQMAQQPAMYAWVGVCRALAAEHYDKCKTSVETIKAQKSKHYRLQRDKKNLKNTEKAVEADVSVDSDYLEAVEAMHEAKKNRDVLSAALDAFEQRKDMLQSIGSNLRNESKTTLQTMKEQAKETLKKKKKRRNQ